MDQISAVRKTVRHDEGYLVRFVKIPASKGYFIEAFCRLDGMIDEKIMQLLSVSFRGSTAVISMLRNENALNPLRVAQVLRKVGIIGKDAMKEVQEFKQCRNTLAHRIHGEHQLAIEESGFFEKEGICHNCTGCLEDHLKSVGAEDLEEYTQKILKSKIAIGIELYGRLQKSFLKMQLGRHRVKRKRRRSK